MPLVNKWLCEFCKSAQNRNDQKDAGSVAEIIPCGIVKPSLQKIVK